MIGARTGRSRWRFEVCNSGVLPAKEGGVKRVGGNDILSLEPPLMATLAVKIHTLHTVREEAF